MNCADKSPEVRKLPINLTKGHPGLCQQQRSMLEQKPIPGPLGYSRFIHFQLEQYFFKFKKSTKQNSHCVYITLTISTINGLKALERDCH